MSLPVINRRNFLGGVAGGLAGMALKSSAVRADDPLEKVVIGVMGVSRSAGGKPGRGTHLATSFAGLPGCEVKYVCDVDSRNIGLAQEDIAAIQGRQPEGVEDFRRILDDQDVDAIVVATPDHWHAPAGIIACQAGKHVYVEKPCCHNPYEGEQFIEAARKYHRHVQMGTQRRSRPGLQEAVQQLHDGAIGEILYARCAYYNARGGIGQGKKVPAPDWLNWSQWQGPAPHRDYQDNVVHYNWHWFWHWGTGELGNNGVHYLDVLRWGLGVDYPTSVSCQGGSLRHQDDQETPDTTVATYEFGKSMVMWEQRSWFRKTSIDADSPMTFFGTNGSLEITDDKGYRILDPAGKELSTGTGASGEADHLRNFLGAIRGAEKLNCEIEEAYRSTLLCLLANISYRVGRKVTLDPQTHQIQGDPEAMKFWQREYEPGYEIKVS